MYKRPSNVGTLAGIAKSTLQHQKIIVLGSV